LLTGNSNGAYGMMHTGDALAEHVAALGVRGAGANVRLVFDNRFKPGLENEAAFNDSPLTCGGGDCTLYDGIASGTSEYSVIGPYTQLQYEPHTAAGNNDGKVRAQLDSWGDAAGANLDQSCVATHFGTADAWKCYDLAHVVAHHVATPFFVRTSLDDTALRTHPTDWSNEPIRDEWTPETFRPRMTKQLEDLFDERAARGDEGLGNTTWSMAVFAPDSEQHVAIVDDPEFLGVCLEEPSTGERHSYMTAIHDWAELDDPSGAGPRAISLIEGSTVHAATRCDGNGPLELIFSDGFESGDLLSWSSSTP
jgi:hypothetical protein